MSTHCLFPQKALMEQDVVTDPKKIFLRLTVHIFKWNKLIVFSTLTFFVRLAEYGSVIIAFSMEPITKIMQCLQLYHKDSNSGTDHLTWMKIPSHYSCPSALCPHSQFYFKSNTLDFLEYTAKTTKIVPLP